MTGLVGPGDPRLASSTALRDVAQLLAVFDARDEQAMTRDRMAAFAADHPDALVRACADGHFTGSALVLDHTGAHTLLLFHRKLQKWLQPGGHADGDGNLAAVAWREATEETGITGLLIDPEPIDVDIHEVRPPKEPPHLHLDVRYLVLAPVDAVVEGNHESEALRWVPVDHLDGLGLDVGTRRLVDAARARFGSLGAG